MRRADLAICILVTCLSTVMHLARPLTAAGEDSSESLPRYQFAPGQELVYKLVSKEESRKSADEGQPQRPELRRETETEWRVYVVQRNDDGSWRLLIRKAEKQIGHRSEDYKPHWSTLAEAALAGKPAPKAGEAFEFFSNAFLGYCDMHPDGRYEMNSSLGDHPSFQVQPEELFCQLPLSETSISEGWEFDAPASGSRVSLRGARGDDGGWEFCGTRNEPTDAVYETTRKLCFHLDDDRGLVRRVTDDRRFGFGGYQCQTVVELIAIEVRSLSWMESLAAEADAYMKTVEKWRAKVEEASIADDAAKCLATMGEARRLLAAGRQEAAIHEIIELYDATLSLHDDNLSLEMAMAVKRQLLLRNPPVEWETTDLTDQQHRSVDYRGKVVVMDFWYRGCEHCVKAMPKIKSLAKKYEAQPVSFLGMSVDQEVENARFVVNKLRLDCPVLRAREIVEQYGLRGYPTFLVLDQSGRVALHAFGNSENLEQAIGSVVDELLAHSRK